MRNEKLINELVDAYMDGSKNAIETLLGSLKDLQKNTNNIQVAIDLCVLVLEGDTLDKLREVMLRAYEDQNIDIDEIIKKKSN